MQYSFNMDPEAIVEANFSIQMPPTNWINIKRDFSDSMHFSYVKSAILL